MPPPSAAPRGDPDSRPHEGAAHPPGGNLAGAVDLLFKCVEAVMAFLLAGMVVMVLGNVILRYGFDTGITSSEELSRIFFVWLTFIGAVVATREGAHLSADGLMHVTPRPVAIGLAVVRELIVIGCCGLLFAGSVAQHEVNATTASLVTGMPIIWVFGIIYVMSAGIIILSLGTLWRIATGRAREQDIFGASGHEQEAAK